MNKELTELKKEFEEKFTYVEQVQDSLNNKVYRHREFNPNNLVTIVDDVWNFFLSLLTKSNEEAEQRGFNKAWGVVKKLMSFGSPEEAETYLQSLDKGKDEKNMYCGRKNCDIGYHHTHKKGSKK